MNKQNIIANFDDFLNSYENKDYVNRSISNCFPIYSDIPISEEYAYLIGKIIGDGNLDHTFTSRFIGTEEDLKLLRDLIVEKFQINPSKCSIRRKIGKGISYMLQVNCAYLGRILHILSAPIGNKTKTCFNIPHWILSRDNLKKRFLQALLEDEMTTIKIRKCNYSIRPRLKLAKKEELILNLRDFMQQVREAILSFGIKCGHLSNIIRSPGANSVELYFFINSNKDNIIKFAENIGFRLNRTKIKNLNECVKILKKTRLNRKPIINESKIINLRKQGYSIRKIGKLVELNSTSVHRVLNKIK